VINLSTASGSSGHSDTLQFGDGISINDLLISAGTNDLNIEIAKTGDRIDLVGQLATGTTKTVNTFTFADNSTYTYNDLIAGGLATSIYGNPTANDTVSGDGGTDVIFGGSGDETVHAGDGAVTVVVGAGTTSLSAEQASTDIFLATP